MDISTNWKAQLAVEHSKNKFSYELLDGPIQDDQYKILNGVIYYKDKIYLVPESTLKQEITEAAHESPLASRSRYLKTYR